LFLKFFIQVIHTQVLILGDKETPRVFIIMVHGRLNF